MVASLLCLTAQVVFNLKEKDKELDKWSTHFLRITACNLLHCQQFSDTFIQNRLCWKGNTFKDYLRNTFYMAGQHSTALTITPENLPPAHECSYCPLEAHEKIIKATSISGDLWPIEA